MLALARVCSLVDPHIHHHHFLIVCVCVCACMRVCVCVWGGVTFPVSHTTACLIFPLSSSQQRNLTLQGLSRLSSRSILSLKCGYPVCVHVFVCTLANEKLSGGMNKCVPSTLG